jgi:hypothetical protein
MSSRVLSLLLSLALLLAILATLITGAFAIVAPMVGQPLETGFSVACADGPSSACSVSREAGPATLRLDRGDIVLPAATADATLLRIVDVALTGGFSIAVIWLLRRFSRDVAGGRPFTRTATRSLTWSATLLMVYPLWQMLRSGLWQLIVLARQPEGGPLIHTFATAHEASSLRLLPEFSAQLLLAGLILLVVARAFAVGVEVQRDSDAVV